MTELTLSGRVAVVTGVSRRAGIGFAIARHLARAGANLLIQHHTPYDAQQPWGADSDGIDALMTELRATGSRIEHIGADFTQADAPAKVIQRAIEAYGHMDILVCNHASSTMGTLENLTAEQVDTHMAVNVRGSLLLIQGFAAQHDDSRSGGRVILMTSGQHLGPMPQELAYIASKGALHQLTLSLSSHLARRKITVNTVNPGATDTGYADAELLEAGRTANPHGRWGLPDDAARLIAWLVSDEAAWITGQVINSTGGGW
jgi:3-oxoacyl-[acyl-carrier protein] reductase